MKKLVPLVLCVLLLRLPVSAVAYQAPEVPETASELMPDNPSSFTDGV